MTSHSVSNQYFNIPSTQMITPYEQYLSMMYRNQFHQNLISYLPSYKLPMAPSSHLQTLPSTFNPSFNLSSPKEVLDKTVPGRTQTKPSQEREEEEEERSKGSSHPRSVTSLKKA